MVKIISSNIATKQEELTSNNRWLSEKLNEDKLLSLKKQVKEGGTLILSGYGIENFNLLIEKKENRLEFFKEKIEYGLVVPLSFRKELFNSLKIYPLYLKNGEKYTESFIIKNYESRFIKVIATSYNGINSYPTIAFYTMGKGIIFLIGTIIENTEDNEWNSYLQLFKDNLSVFLINRKYKNKGELWKYYFPKFDNISFLLKENNPLGCKKRLILKEHRKHEKFNCKNKRIYYENIGMLGKIISPPIEGVYDFSFDIDDKLNINHHSKIITYSGQTKKIDLHMIPDIDNPTVFLYISPKEDLEIKIHYKIHFKMLPPFPEYYYSKINYSVSEDNRMLIAHTYDNNVFFINRFGLPPTELKIIPNDEKTPSLTVRIILKLKKNVDNLIQFSLIYKEEKIKKSELKKILHPLKKKTIDSAIKHIGGKSLKVIMKKGEKSINYRKMVLNLLEKLYYTEKGILTLIDTKKTMQRKEIAESLINLAIFGYVEEVEEIIKNHRELKRFPVLIYSSGATVFDYSEKAVNSLNKISLYINELKSGKIDSEMIPSIIKKKISLFYEYNFRGYEYWNTLISNLSTLYFTILNPLLTKDSIVFIPIIPYFIKQFSVKNIKIENKNFNFSYKRKGRKITVKFKNNNNSPININYYPVFMRKIEKFEFDLTGSKELNFQIDRDYLLYSREYDFQEKPELFKQEDRIKITFNGHEDKNHLIYLYLEIFDKDVKKIVGSRINKGITKEERILLYNPSLSKSIYIYFKDIPKTKYLFPINKEQK